jgi:serine/threonine-protein kinase
VSPSKVVRDLDPRIERAIVRCLEPTPARRPASASEVASTLPGGDRLAAAMAAGETPSPELVAAATGRAEGLRPEVAWGCLAVLAIGLAALTAIAPSTRLVARVPITEAPEAMAGQASDLLRDLGVPGPPVDRVFGTTRTSAR